MKIDTVKTKNGVLIVSAFFFIIFIANSIANVKWNYLIVLVFPLLLYISMKEPFIFPFGAYVLLIPFDAVLSVTGIAKITTVTKILGILTILVLLLKGSFERKFKHPDSATIWVALFVLYGVLSISWAIEPGLILSRIPTAIGLLIFYVIASSYKINEKEFNILKYCIFIGAIIASLYSIYDFIIGKTLFQRATITLNDQVMNPNALAFALLMPLSICTGMMIKQNERIKKLLLITIFGVMLLAIFLSGSRKCLLGAGVIFIVYSFLAQKRVTFWIIAIAIGSIIISFVPDMIVERAMHLVKDRGAGRLDIWTVGLKGLEKYFLLGAGLDNFPAVYDQYMDYAPHFVGFRRGPHNIYLSVIVELGIVGLSLMFFMIWKHYRAIQSRVTQRGGSGIMLQAAFWAILVSGFFMDVIWDKAFWLLWMMIMMHKNILQNNSIPNEKTILIKFK